MASQSVSARLRESSLDIWRRIMGHPCVQGLGAGTLNKSRLRYFLGQDYLFLEDYGRALAFAGIKAPTPTIASYLFGRISQSLDAERDFILKQAELVGLSLEVIQAAEKVPAMQAYADHLVRTAALGTYAQSLSTLLACNWCYLEMGEQWLKDLKSTGAENRRKQDRSKNPWIEMYTSDAMHEAVAWYWDAVDNASQGLSTAQLAVIEESFKRSSRYELRVWDAVLNLEGWD